MTKLKLASVQDEKPVKMSVALPAALHRDLLAYAEILSREVWEAHRAFQIGGADVGGIHRKRSGICQGAGRAG